MELWTSATPNGWKVSIMLEELIEAGAELDEITVKHINLASGEQHSPEFLAHNPNAKIPVLIDGNRSIMESCAILQYLGKNSPRLCYPKTTPAGTSCPGSTGRRPTSARCLATNSVTPVTWTLYPTTRKPIH